MNLRMCKTKRRLIVVLTVLLLVQLACDASPDDSRVAPALFNIMVPMNDMFTQLNALPGNYLLPPMITSLEESSDNSQAMVSGLGNNKKNLIKPNSVRIYTVTHKR